MVRPRLLLGEVEKGFEVSEPDPALGADPEHPERPTSDKVVDERSGHSEVVGDLVEGQGSLVHKWERFMGSVSTSETSACDVLRVARPPERRCPGSEEAFPHAGPPGQCLLGATR